MNTLSLSIDGMSCGHCVANVRRTLESLPGLHVQDVQIGSALVHLADNSAATVGAVVTALADAGYAAAPRAPEPTTAPATTKAGSCCSTDAAVTPSTAGSA
ncbi:MAG: cation transporter [Gemmatimonas sp.]